MAEKYEPKKCDPNCNRRDIEEILQPRISELCDEAGKLVGPLVGNCALNDVDYNQTGNSR